MLFVLWEVITVSERTIAAVSTPPGSGGIGVIRISGDNALKVADRCFKAFSGQPLDSLDGYRAAYGRIISDGETVDDAVALVFRAPKSYTGEDVVEISAHGGSAVMKRVLRTVLKCGAAAAEGGEFTKRAFLNGKLDLSEAEAVMGVISARNDAALRISRAAKDGRLSKEIDGITQKLTHTAAAMGVYADYPDDEIPELDSRGFPEMLSECKEKLCRLLESYDAGKAVREGIDCAIVGKPNVGKSTVMNALCGADRSIVTDIAGTTRDVIESTVAVGDVLLTLSDTAGLHETDDAVEAAGIDRARKSLCGADLIIAVFDLSRPADKNDTELIGQLYGRPHIAVLNKSDCAPVFDEGLLKDFKTVKMSAKNGTGLDLLKNAVTEAVGVHRLSAEDAVLISERQRDCAARALDGINEALSALSAGVTLDAVGVCIDDALSALFELTGKRVTNEVADEVFRSFCVGK